MRVYVVAIATLVAMIGCQKDDVANPVAITTKNQAEVSSGITWQLVRGKDELNDEPRVTAQVIGNGVNERNVLTLRCAGKRLEAFASFDDYLGNDIRPVKYRLDKADPIEDTWSISAKGTAVFATQSADFARQLISAKKLIVEVEDYRGVPHRAIFEWENDAKPIAEVLTACGRQIEGLEVKFPGLRKEVALEIERWGPRNILLKKQVLAAVAGFKGDIDSQMTSDFALSLQAFHDDYLVKCKTGKIKSSNCDTIKILLSGKKRNNVSDIGSILYDVAPKSLKKEVGNLLISQ